MLFSTRSGNDCVYPREPEQYSGILIREAYMVLNILKYPWHTGHDYELAKLPHQFCYLASSYRSWATEQRPIPSNIKWVANPSEQETDLMILHLDQWSWQEPAKRYFYQHLKSSYPGRKIVLIHGAKSPDGCSAERMAELTEGCTVVCNSKRALEDWSLPNSHFILHGFSPEEWPQTSYSRDNILLVQPYRERHAETRNQLLIDQAEQKLKLCWIGRDVQFSSFRTYRNFLSESSVFFNPSFHSANPRSRAEAMLCGLAVVTTAAHGEEEYIENGETGFCSNDPKELVDFLLYLKEKPCEARRIGENGRLLAQKLFHIERYIEDWGGLLQ